MLKTPADVVRTLTTRLRTQRTKLLAAEVSDGLPLLELPLGKPSSQDVRTLGGLEVKRSIDAWRAFEEAHPAFSLRWAEAVWPGLGRVPYPERLWVSPTDFLLSYPDGTLTGERWHRHVARLRRFVRDIESAAELEELVPILTEDFLKSGCADLPDADYAAFKALSAWLSENAPRAVFVREIPVPGVDTKWFERHAGLLARMAYWTGVAERLGVVVRRGANAADALLARTLTAEALTLACGFRTPEAFVTVRNAFDWVRAEDGGLNAPVGLAPSTLARKPPECGALLIVENLQTGLSVDVPPELPVLMGMGYGAARLEQLPWRNDVRVLYMGDLDSDGLRILSLVRKIFPKTESLLTDTDTFERYERFAVDAPERTYPKPENLTEPESELWDELEGRRGRAARLEQERIPLATLQDAVRLALTGKSVGMHERARRMKERARHGLT